MARSVARFVSVVDVAKKVSDVNHAEHHVERHVEHHVEHRTINYT